MHKNELNVCYKYKPIHFRRFLNNCGINSTILSDLFGLTSIKAKWFIEKNKLQNKDEEQMINSINVCRKFGYTNEEILNSPGLLRVNALVLEQHYLTLEEGGFQPIGPKILVRAGVYMKRMINSLKLMKVIPQNTVVSENFLSYIKDMEIVKSIPTSQFSDDDQWSEVHKSILETFLKLKLNATEDEIIRLFRIHRMIKNKSFRIIQENIALAEDLGFEKRKILKYGYLLHNYPNYTKTVLQDFPNLAGSDMRKAMRIYPKLVMTSPTNIIKIYGILKEFNIEDEVIRKQMNVFHMSPNTVKLRLEEIGRSPDFKVLLTHPKILSLIVHHNRAISRLTFLQQLQIRCASPLILGTNCQEVFDDYVREGKDINKTTDVTLFLKELFSVKTEIIKKKLKIHPFSLQVPIKDMQNTYDYLIEQHFQPHNIFKVMHILLYPSEKIEKAFKKIKANKEIPFQSLKQTRKLNLALYFIEREYHFTGNGIWRKSDTVLPSTAEKSLK